LRRFDLLLALGCSATTLACGAILGLQEPTIDDTIEAGGNDSGGGDTASDVPNTCGADLQSDAKNCGKCGHDCLGGTCSSGACQPVLVASSTSLAPYAMTMAGTDLIFTNVRGTSLATVFKVAANATNGNPTQLVDYGTGYTTPLVDGYPYGVAAQGTDFYTSITANGGSGGNWEAGVDRCPQTGCTQKTVAFYGVNSSAVTTSSSNVFFGSYDTNDVYIVQMANLDMSNRQTIASPASEVLGILFDGGDLFYATTDGVFHCKGTTCDTAAITQGQAIDAELLAADSANVYFTSLPSADVPTVQSVARAGGLPKLISNKPMLPFAVATDGTNVYFTDIGDINVSTTGAVYRCPVTGCNGNEELLSNGAAAGDNPRPIVVDAQFVYWGTRGGKIWRLAK